MLTIEEIQAELQEEIDLCNKYFIEEDMHKESTEHERLALKIVTMCMQTLSALKDGELEDYKHIKQWKSDIMDSFCRYDVNSFEELVTNVRNKTIDDFVTKIKKYMETTEQATYIDEINNGNDNYSAMTIYDYVDELANELKVGGKNE